jgi:ATP-dependent RNA helicase DDX3X
MNGWWLIDVCAQLQDMERGVDILVATLGWLNDLLERVTVSLSMVCYLALDEANRMLDMGFETQIHIIFFDENLQ